MKEKKLKKAVRKAFRNEKTLLEELRASEYGPKVDFICSLAISLLLSIGGSALVVWSFVKL